MKKYWFWIVLTLVVLGGAFYWWRNNKPTTKKDEETKDTSKSYTNTNPATTTTASNASGNYLDKNCGGLEAVWKKFADPKDTFFRNQWLGDSKFKCQTALAQVILNDKEKAGLVVDGDFGPATKAAVKKAFGKERVNLSEFDVKYRLTKIVTGNDTPISDILESPWK